MTVGKPRRAHMIACADQPRTLREWVAVWRRRGDLGLVVPVLLEQLAAALDAMPGFRVQAITMDLGCIVVEQSDGRWACRLPPADSLERGDLAPVQTRLIRLLRHCLEPELATAGYGPALCRLQAVMRRGESELPASRYGSCAELARAVNRELPAMFASARIGGLVAGEAPLPRDGRTPPSAVVGVDRGRGRHVVVAGCVFVAGVLAFLGCHRAVTVTPGEVAESPSPLDARDSRPSPTCVRPRAPGTDERPIASAADEFTDDGNDTDAPPAVGRPPVAPSIPVDIPPPAPAAEIEGIPYHQEPSGVGDGGHADSAFRGSGCIPASVTLDSGATVFPDQALAQVPPEQADGTRIMGPEGMTLTGLVRDAADQDAWSRVAFRCASQQGVCDLQEGGVMKAAWSTRTEDLDGKRSVLRACGQFMVRDDGTLVRDGTWISWDEENQVLTVAVYDPGNRHQVIVYRNGAEDRQQSEEGDVGDSRRSCPAFAGIDSIAKSVQAGVARHAVAGRAHRHESAQAEARRAAVVRLGQMQQARAAAQARQAQEAQAACAAMISAMSAMSHPSRSVMLGLAGQYGGGVPVSPGSNGSSVAPTSFNVPFASGPRTPSVPPAAVPAARLLP